MNIQILDLYTDYQIASFSKITVTGLSESLGGSISHDMVTRFLSEDDYDSKQFWKLVKPNKSMKTNLGFGKSPTQTTRTQRNHIFATLYAYFKLELLKMKTGLNHFALKAKLYLKALQTSMDELRSIKVQYCLS